MFNCVASTEKMESNVLQTKTEFSCQDEGCQSPEERQLNL